MKQETLSEKYASGENQSRINFKNHLYIYLGVIGLFIIINALTYDGKIWVHWLAILWALVLFIHWCQYKFAPNIISPRSIRESSSISQKKLLPASILCLFFGIFGAHRFYAGKVASGWFQALTIGGMGIWYTIDLIIVLFGEFTDSEGKKIKEWL